jgi:hypothetical protein
MGLGDLQGEGDERYWKMSLAVIIDRLLRVLKSLLQAWGV